MSTQKPPRNPSVTTQLDTDEPKPAPKATPRPKATKAAKSMFGRSKR